MVYSHITIMPIKIESIKYNNIIYVKVRVDFPIGVIAQPGGDVVDAYYNNIVV